MDKIIVTIEVKGKDTTQVVLTKVTLAQVKEALATLQGPSQFNKSLKKALEYKG